MENRRLGILTLLTVLPLCPGAASVEAFPALSVTELPIPLKTLDLADNEIVDYKMDDYSGHGTADLIVLTRPQKKTRRDMPDNFADLYFYRKKADAYRLMAISPSFPIEVIRSDSGFLVGETKDPASGVFQTGIIDAHKPDKVKEVLKHNVRFIKAMDVDGDGIAEIIVDTSPDYIRRCFSPEIVSYKGLRVLAEQTFEYAPDADAALHFYRKLGWKGEFPTESNPIFFGQDFDRTYTKNELETLCQPENQVSQTEKY